MLYSLWDIGRSFHWLGGYLSSFGSLFYSSQLTISISVEKWKYFKVQNQKIIYFTIIRYVAFLSPLSDILNDKN